MARKGGRGFRAPKDYDPRRFDRRKKAGSQPKAAQKQNQEPKISVAKARPAKARTFEEVGLNPPKITAAQDTQGLTFKDLGVGDNITRALAELGADAPFPIQAVSIPDIIAGKNLLGRAQTGSGKTLAFGVGVVERILKLKSSSSKSKRDRHADGKPKRGTRMPKSGAVSRKPSALILAPTRELALQIDAQVQPLARSVGLFTAQLVGGMPAAPQVHALKRGIDIVIGTPGRVEDLLKRRSLDLSGVQIAVLDEADHMSEMGFIEPVTRILRGLSQNQQTLLFSATLDSQVRAVVGEFMPDHVSHKISLEFAASTPTKHVFFVTNYEEKVQVSQEILRRAKRALVFVRTRAYAEMLAHEFTLANLKVTTLHGNLSQERRLLNLDRFSSGRANILVATDVAARGIHVDDVEIVLQADPPSDSKAYLHRAGRTGRAGESGVAVTLVPRTQQKRTKQLLEEAEIEAAYFGEVFAGKAEKLLKGIKKDS